MAEEEEHMRINVLLVSLFHEKHIIRLCREGSFVCCLDQEQRIRFLIQAFLIKKISEKQQPPISSEHSSKANHSSFLSHQSDPLTCEPLSLKNDVRRLRPG